MEIEADEKKQNGPPSATSTSISTSSPPGVVTTSATDPNSEYIIEGLTPYEMHRRPREPITDESTTVMPIRILNKDLTCPICLNIIHNTLTVMECLHRFCNACISKSLRTGRKECPTCRIPCMSRRNLRPDPNFDALIKVLYPDLEKYEQQEETMIQQINNEYVAKVMAATVEEGMKRQAKAKRIKDKIKEIDKTIKVKDKDKEKKSKPKKVRTSSDGIGVDGPSSSSPSSSLPPKIIPSIPPEEVGLAVAPHPREKMMGRLDRPFLRIPAGACVRHVIKFLAIKFPSIDSSSIRLILGSTVTDIIRYSKGDSFENMESAIAAVPDIGNVPHLNEELPLPVLRDMWNRRDEILLLYYLVPSNNNIGNSKGVGSPTVKTETK
jgi:hypothetical protein